MRSWRREPACLPNPDSRAHSFPSVSRRDSPTSRASKREWPQRQWPTPRPTSRDQRCRSCSPRPRQESPGESATGEHAEEDQPLQHRSRRMRRVEAALQQSAARRDAAKKKRYQDHNQRILTRKKSHEDACVTEANDEGFARGAMDGHDLYRACQSCCRPTKEAGKQDQAANGQANHLRGASIATKDIHGKTNRGVAQQQMQRETDHETDHQPPMHRPARDVADHEAFRDRPTLGFERLREIAYRTADQMVEQGNSDIVEQQGGYGLIDTAEMLQRPRRPDPQPAGQSARGDCEHRSDHARRIAECHAGQHGADSPEYNSAFSPDNEQTNASWDKRTKRGQ